MPVVASGFVHQKRVEAAVAKAAKALAPEVVRIRFTIGEDWSGSPSVFFRVVLTDKASEGRRLRSITERVAAVISNALRPDELGLETYFNFRNVSEQAQLQESNWE